MQWLARPLGTPSFRVRSSDQACFIRLKTWLSTLETVYLLWGAVLVQWLERRFETWSSSFTQHFLWLSDERLKAVGPFSLVSMPGEVKDPTREVNVIPVVDSTFLPS